MSKQNNDKSPEMILLESYIKACKEQLEDKNPSPVEVRWNLLKLEADIITKLEEALRELRNNSTILKNPHINKKRSWE